jgi:hypothetical protein
MSLTGAIIINFGGSHHHYSVPFIDKLKLDDPVGAVTVQASLRIYLERGQVVIFGCVASGAILVQLYLCRSFKTFFIVVKFPCHSGAYAKTTGHQGLNSRYSRARHGCL